MATAASRRAALANTQSLIRFRQCLEDTITALLATDSNNPPAGLLQLATALQQCANQLTPLTDDGLVADADASAANAPVPSYLHWLPDGAVDNVVRHMSDRPRSRRWERYIADGDVLTLYSGTGPLSAVFRDRFLHVALCSVAKPKVVCTPPIAATVSGDQPVHHMRLYMRDVNQGTLTALRRSGARFESLAYHGAVSKYQPSPHCVSWIPPFVAHCTRVRALNLSNMELPLFHLVVGSVARRLESLTVNRYCTSFAHLDFVTQNCHALVKLNMSFGPVPPTVLWEKVGKSLKELTFSLAPRMDSADSTADMKSMADDIGKHCRGLTKIIAFHVPSAMNEPMVDLLATYGDQLEIVGCNFSFMDFGQCRRIAEVCTKAVFELQALTRLAVLEDLNFRVRNLDISEMNVLNQPEMELVGTKCAELRSMTIRRLEVRAPAIIEGLLKSPKPKLTDIYVELREDNAPEVLFKLAELTTTLVKFRLRVKSLVADGLAELFVANPSIDLVEITCGDSFTKKVEKVAESVFQKAKVLEQLHELTIISSSHVRHPRSRPPAEETLKEPSQKLAEMCVSLRSKNVVVHAFGVDYLK